MTKSMLARFMLAASMAVWATTSIAAEPGAERSDESPDRAAESAPEDQTLSPDQIYEARRLGLQLYSEKKYQEAYPHLMTAAKHGFKRPQAQLGFMHLSGLGNTKKDTRYAIGWLGVAADGLTERPIEKYFNDIWRKIPQEHVPGYQKLVDSFVANYGTDANDIKCERVNKRGSKIRQVRCELTDPNGRPIRDELEDAFRATMQEFEQYGGGSAPGGGPGGGSGEPR